MKRWCEKKVPWAKKNERIFCIPSFMKYFSYLLELLIKNDSISCWSQVLTWLRPKWWRYLYCKYHFGANNWCDRNVPCLVSEQLIQGLHCSCLTPPVMVPTACRNNMISASIQQMLHLGCIIQWFSDLDLPFESSEVSQNQRRSKHNWAGVGGEHCGYYSWGWSSVPLL